MADKNRDTRYSVEQELQEDPYSFSFLNAVRMLECIHSDKPRLGSSQRATDDPVRLSHGPSLAFESSTITSFELGKGDEVSRLESRFLGLFGPNGPLPLHLTEYTRDRIRHSGDRSLAAFSDVFHHRMLCLFYRAWANAEPTVHHDRPQSDRFGYYVGSTFGLGMESLRGVDAIADRNKLYFAGLLACQTHHPEGLESILNAYFGVQVQVCEFIGEWLELPENSLWHLGRSRITGTLGSSVVLGARVWNCQSKFRLLIGPLDRGHYDSFLPGGECMEHVLALVRNYIGDEMYWDINLVLRTEEVPPLQLNGTCRLGWSTWLCNRTGESDAGDLVLDAAVRAA